MSAPAGPFLFISQIALSHLLGEHSQPDLWCPLCPVESVDA